MGKLVAILLACLLPLTASAQGTALKDTENDWLETVHLRVEDGYLRMTIDDEESYQPVAVKEGFVDAVRALEESGEEYALYPDGMDPALMALLDDSLTGGARVRNIDVQHRQILLFLEGPGDGWTLRVARWNGEGYDVLDNPTFPAESWMDTTHCDDGMVIWMDVAEIEGWAVYLYETEEGDWRMGVRTDTICWEYVWQWHALVDTVVWEDGGNEGYYYGEFPMEMDFADFDVAGFPTSLEEALTLLDRSGWAVVNNPNPEDRLSLYAAPDKDAKALGEFYNRAPVRVVGSQGEWTEVVIGEEDESLTGWMMTECLAFGETMDDVACAFPRELELKNGKRNCPVRIAPEEDAVTTWIFNPWYDIVYGVLGDEWYIVIESEEGKVGYVPQDWFTQKAP